MPNSTHVTNAADRTDVVVFPFTSPSGDSGVVNGTVEGEIHLNIPFKFIENRTGSTDATLKRGMSGDIIGEFVPMPGRGFGVGAIGPELGDHASVVAMRNDLGIVG